MSRLLSYLLLAALALPLRAQPGGPKLLGVVVANRYISPTKAFDIEIPVLRELGGVIRGDTPNVVTFEDTFGTYITVGAFKQDATQKFELSTRGIKDYLIYFFGAFVLPDFKQVFPGTTLESAAFSPGFSDGTLFTYVLLPGGSVVLNYTFPDTPKPVAKRGNAVFCRNGFTFLISTELGEKVTEGKYFTKTTAEEDTILRQRLVAIINKMAFPRPATPPTPTPASP